MVHTQNLKLFAKVNIKDQCKVCVSKSLVPREASSYYISFCSTGLLIFPNFYRHDC